MEIRTYNLELNEYKHPVMVEDTSRVYSGGTLNSDSAAVEMLEECFSLSRQAEEKVYMIALDTKNNPIGVFEVSHGSVNTSCCSPREIFIRALLCGAVRIIIAHNHPSGDTTPSKDDLEAMEKIRCAGEHINIRLIDFLIVAGGKHKSCISYSCI